MTTIKMTKEEQRAMVQDYIDQSTTKEQRENEEQRIWELENGFEVAIFNPKTNDNSMLVFNHSMDKEEVIETDYEEWARHCNWY
jgi:hypothetical protein